MFSNRIFRRAVVVAGVLCVIVVGGAVYFVWMMSQPLYRFGSVQRGENLRGSLEPPPQVDDSVWQVEPDIKLHFESRGEGSPVLVIHGGPGVPYDQAWKGLESLNDRFRFYYYHQRGCGASTRPFDRFNGNYYENMLELEQTLGLGAQVADIERIRKILGVEQITLIGHSFGGFLAALYAAEFPSHVDKLVLVAPAGLLTPPDQDRDLFAQTRQRLGSEERQAFDSLLARYLDFGDLFSKSDSELAKLHQQLGVYLIRAMGYETHRSINESSVGGWMVYAIYFSMGRSQDYRPALGEIRASTLIVVGEDDTVSFSGAATYEEISGAKMRSIERTDEDAFVGHFVFDDAPEAFARGVASFLAESDLPVTLED